MYPNYNSEPQNPPKELYNTNRHAVQPTSRPNTAAPKTRSSRKITNETYDNDSSKFSSRKRSRSTSSNDNLKSPNLQGER